MTGTIEMAKMSIEECRFILNRRSVIGALASIGLYKPAFSRSTDNIVNSKNDLLLEPETIISPESTSEYSMDVKLSFSFSYIESPSAADRRVGNFIYSNDKRKFIVVVRNGDPDRLMLFHDVWLFDIDQIETMMCKADYKLNPVGRRIVHWVTSDKMNNFGYHARPAMIHGFRWLEDNSKIFFIGKEDKDTDQVYSIDIFRGILKKETECRGPVVNFDVSAGGETLAYLELVDKNRENGQNITHKVVGTNSFDQMEPFIFGSFGANYSNAQLVIEGPHVGQGGRHVINIESNQRLPLWVSPAGTETICVIPAEPDTVWSGIYDGQEMPFLSNGTAERGKLKFYTNIGIRQWGRFYLFDHKTKRSLALLNAPVIIARAQAKWSDNSKSIILAYTYLPNKKTSDRGKTKSSPWPYIIDYDIHSKTYRIVHHILGNRDDPVDGWWDGNILFDKDRSILVERYNAKSGRPKLIIYSKKNGSWHSRDRNIEKNDNNIVFYVNEGINTPPEMFLKETRSGVERQISNFNIKFSSARYGKALDINWKDKQGDSWRGTLVFPVDYEKHKLYPIVIQQRGLIPGEFLVGGYGGSGAPFAARPLAARNIMVLTMAGSPLDLRDWSIEKMIPLCMRGVESAVEALVERGFTDGKRIGLTGWSATGVPVLHALTFGGVKITAAIIADAVSSTMSGYTAMFGSMPPGMGYVEKLYGGAQPWGSNLVEWVERNPVFHLDKIQCPLLIQNYLSGTMIGWWDVYAILRRLGRPVEMVQYPDAEHSPLRPDQFLHAQESVADWYSFWLTGEVPHQDKKGDQMMRWALLREIVDNMAV